MANRGTRYTEILAEGRRQQQLDTQRRRLLDNINIQQQQQQEIIKQAAIEKEKEEKAIAKETAQEAEATATKEKDNLKAITMRSQTDAKPVATLTVVKPKEDAKPGAALTDIKQQEASMLDIGQGGLTRKGDGEAKALGDGDEPPMDPTQPGWYEYWSTHPLPPTEKPLEAPAEPGITITDTAGFDYPPPVGDITQVSLETQSLIDKIIAESGCTNQEALELVQHYLKAVRGEVDDLFTGNALLNRHPHLTHLLQAEFKGRAFNDITQNVPVIAFMDDEGKVTQVMLLKNEVAEKINGMTPEEQFKALKDLGVYPFEWEWGSWVGADGKQQGGVLTGDQIKIINKQGQAYAALYKAGAIGEKGSINLITAIEKGMSDDDILAVIGESDRARQSLADARKIIKDFENDLVRQPLMVQDAYKKGGYEAYIKAVTNYNQLQREITTYKELFLSSMNVNAGINRKATAYEKATYVLEDFKNADGSYDVIAALRAGLNAGTNAEQVKIIDAVEYLFGERDLKEIRDKWPGLFRAGGKEELEETGAYKQPSQFQVGYNEAVAALPAGLVGAAGYTKNTPMPQDDVLALIILGSIGTAGGITKIIKNFTSENERPPSLGDIYVGSGNSLMPLKWSNIPGTEGTITDKIPQFVPFKEQIKIVPRPVEFESIPFNTPDAKDYIEEFLFTKDRVILWWPTPYTQKAADDYIVAYENVVKATQETNKKAGTLEIPVNYNKILEEANASKRMQIFEEINRVITAELSKAKALSLIRKDIKLDQYIRDLNSLSVAHQEYLMKYRIWQNAWKSYVKAIDPKPIKGALTHVDKATLAAASLLTPSETPPVTKLKRGWVKDVESEVDKKYHTELEEKQANKQKVLQGVKDRAVADYKSELKKLLGTQGITFTSDELQRAQDMAREYATGIALQTLTLPLTKPTTITKLAVKEAVGEAINEIEETETAELTATAELTTQKKKKKPDSDDTDKKKREYLEGVPGFIARRRGALGGRQKPKAPLPTASDKDKRAYLAKVKEFKSMPNGKREGQDVWLVNYYPYGTKDRMVLLGAKPEGATLARGKGSLQKTAILLKGKPPEKPIHEDTGAVDDVITAQGKDIKVTSRRDKSVKIKAKPRQLKTAPANTKLIKKSETPQAINAKELKQKELKEKKLKPSRSGIVKVRTFDIGGGIEIDKTGRGHIKL